MAGTYKLSDDQLFLGSVDGHAISVYRLDAPDLSKVREEDFSEEATISIGHISPQHNSRLELFGVEVTPNALRRLLKHLDALRIRVNRQGFCYHLTETCLNGAQDIEYYRLNDLLNWSNYGVRRQVTFNWDRCDILFGNTLQQNGNGKGTPSPSLPQPPPTKPPPTPPPPPPPMVSLRQRPVPSSWFVRQRTPDLPFQPSLFPKDTKNSKFTPLANPGNYRTPTSLGVFGIDRFDVNNWFFLYAVGDRDKKSRAIAYYDGQYNATLSPAICLPFSGEVRMDLEGFLAIIEGLGLRFVVSDI